MSHQFFWVIRTKKPDPCHFFGAKFSYSAERTAPKNKRHLTPIHYRVKLFVTKDTAWKFYYKKTNAGCDMSNCTVTRKKIFLHNKTDAKKYGWYDYFKNAGSF